MRHFLGKKQNKTKKLSLKALAWLGNVTRVLEPVNVARLCVSGLRTRVSKRGKHVHQDVTLLRVLPHVPVRYFGHTLGYARAHIRETPTPKRSEAVQPSSRPAVRSETGACEDCECFHLIIRSEFLVYSVYVRAPTSATLNWENFCYATFMHLNEPGTAAGIPAPLDVSSRIVCSSCW